MQPTRGLFVAERADHPYPLLGLASNGDAEPCELPRMLVRSYRTVSPLPDPTSCDVGHRRFAFCCTQRQVTPTRLSPAFCPVKPRLSSDSFFRRTRGHPTDSPSLISLRVRLRGGEPSVLPIPHDERHRVSGFMRGIANGEKRRSAGNVLVDE